MTPDRPRRRARRGRRATVAVLGFVLTLVVTSVAAAAQDPYRPQQWNLDRIGAPDAWPVADGDGQVIAVIDSGVDLEHPDLVDRFLRDDDGRVVGRDVVEDDDEPQDPLGHGTMVAGIALATADNGEGVAGVAPGARLLPVRVLDEQGRGTSADVDAGIRWAVDNGATVVNLSLESATTGDGDQAAEGGPVAAPVAAVQYAWDNGVVVVAAAGNSGNAFTDYPRASPVVLVGATDRDDARTTFSDSGRDDLLMAPGIDVVSTWCRQAGDDQCRPDVHSYGIADGTSFAAPHVAGALAVVRSAGLEPAAAIERLRATARDLDDEGRDANTGHGLVDVAAAVEGIEPRATGTATSTPEPTPPDTPTPDTPTRGPTTPASPAPTGPPDAPSPTVPEDVGTPGEVTVPDVEATPVAAPDTGDGVRTLWALVTSVLVVVTAAAVGRTWVRDA